MKTKKSWQLNRAPYELLAESRRGKLIGSSPLRALLRKKMLESARQGSEAGLRLALLQGCTPQATWALPICSEALRICFERQHPSSLKYLLIRSFPPGFFPDTDLRFELRCAVESGDLLMVHHLLLLQASPQGGSSQSGLTLLGLAQHQGNADLAKLLLAASASARFNFSDPSDQDLALGSVGRAPMFILFERRPLFHLFNTSTHHNLESILAYPLTHYAILFRNKALFSWALSFPDALQTINDRPLIHELFLHAHDPVALEYLQMLFAAGADPDELDTEGKKVDERHSNYWTGMTFFFSAQNLHPQMIEHVHLARAMKERRSIASDLPFSGPPARPLPSFSL